MPLEIDRRQFISVSAGALAASAAFPALSAEGRQAAQAPSPFKTTLRKALILNKPTPETLREAREAGFEGVEAGVLPVADAAAVRAAADAVGMRIHSVIRGSAAFNSAKQEEVDQSFAVTEDALRAAQVYGADAVLLVPGRISAMTPGGFGQKGGILMPRPWEFQVEFDPKTGHLTRVVHGDNSRYAEYIRAQNHAIDTSAVHVRRLIPLAEKTGVVIALENVWNHLWVTPAHFRHFVESFQSPWVQAYYDIGNHVKYGAPESWVLTLGRLIVKVHVKDYRLNPSDADGQGAFVNLREGSVRWPIVRRALDDVGYSGWMTIEAPIKISLAEQVARLDAIFRGE